MPFMLFSFVYKILMLFFWFAKICFGNVNISCFSGTSGVRRNLSSGDLQVKNTIIKSGPGHGTKTFPNLHSKLVKSITLF